MKHLILALLLLTTGCASVGGPYTPGNDKLKDSYINCRQKVLFSPTCSVPHGQTAIDLGITLGAIVYCHVREDSIPPEVIKKLDQCMATKGYTTKLPEKNND